MNLSVFFILYSCILYFYDNAAKLISLSETIKFDCIVSYCIVLYVSVKNGVKFMRTLRTYVRFTIPAGDLDECVK